MPAPLQSEQIEYRIDGTIDAEIASRFAAFLALHRGKPVRVIVHSPGGDALAGAAMQADAAAHGLVTFVVRGVAASSGSFLLLGGKTVIMHPAAFLMCHLPWTVTMGDEHDHRAAADLLEKVGRSDAEAYSRFTGHPVARVRAWLAEELWLTAEEAVALNFADGIEEGGRAEPLGQHDYTKHANAPQALHRLARENGWAADPSEQQTER